MSDQTEKRQHPGIECDRCGSGTTVEQSQNFVTFIRRKRRCKNEKCDRFFWTTEMREQRVRDLFDVDES